jgi:hypothetical protein
MTDPQDTTRHQRDSIELRRLCAARDDLRAKLTESESERMEQARLLGISAERELALMGQLAAVTAERDSALQSAEIAKEIGAQYGADAAAALGLLSHVRMALGDKGRRDQNELIAWCKELTRIGGQMANVCFNFAQYVGQPVTSDDVAMFDKLRKQWDAARKGQG